MDKQNELITQLKIICDIILIKIKTIGYSYYHKLN